MALPTEADAFGPGREDVERYLPVGAAIDGVDRVRLFRLAWDTCLSAFAGRQSLYEYYFFGDPVRMAGALVARLRPGAVQGARARAARRRRGRCGMNADVIVVGSGSGGLRARAAAGRCGPRSCSLEAGGPDDEPGDPRSRPGCSSSGTVPTTGAADRAAAGLRRPRLLWPRGKVLGGSSSMNGMVYIRGHRLDYDGWAYHGCRGWGYDDVLPLFRRSEDFDGGASEFHGAGGPLHVTDALRAAPVHRGGGGRGAGGRHPVQRRPQRRRAGRGRLCQLTIRTAAATAPRSRSSRRSPTRRT